MILWMFEVESGKAVEYRYAYINYFHLISFLSVALSLVL